MSVTPLSVLDLSPISSGSTAAAALRNTLDLARHTERLGYRRYWLAEHHLAPGVASSAPAVLAGLVAAATTRIRVGSAAVQLGHVAPLAVAEQFGTLAQLHPDRVDVGLGRSPLAGLAAGTSPARPPRKGPAADRVADGLLIPAVPAFDVEKESFQRIFRLIGSNSATHRDYHADVGAVLDFLDGGHVEAESGVTTHSPVAEGVDAQVWILGSSGGESARTAGALGLPFGANYHVSPSTILETVRAYREAFRPSRRLAEPYVVVSVDVVVGPDDDTARELASPFGQWVLSIRAGEGAIRYPSPKEAAQFPWTDEQRRIVRDRTATQLVGSPDTVARGLAVLRDATAADELLVTTITHEHADRVRSYDLLAAAWGLGTSEGEHR
ncbi:MsnO8 family LLM class oxidoreductase [Jiangella endophytica]|uniref:MsnO8 family LLM class oxidoreductase n=1 Tax=Jiangella endophytica TaxID=1623398 RepID=UPI000E347844|nr:MsnO8 family LLM class oxidoreductase [Jiangella endophytica]